MADPGFPVGGGGGGGGRRAVGEGGTNLQCGCFSVKMYVKTKELDPVGVCAPEAPPGSANEEATE